MMLRAIDHVQIAIPAGGEDAARPFYRDLLGMTEVAKTGVQATRGGCWFEAGEIKVHLGVEEPFRANRKAHVAFVVDDVRAIARDLQRTAWLQSQGYRVVRFPEKEVRDRLREVVERIAAEATPPPSPTLPPSRGKGEARYQVR